MGNEWVLIHNSVIDGIFPNEPSLYKEEIFPISGPYLPYTPIKREDLPSFSQVFEDYILCFNNGLISRLGKHKKESTFDMIANR